MADFTLTGARNGLINRFEAKFKDSYLNQLDYINDLDLARTLFMNRFIWDSPLTAGRRPEYIERCILNYGSVGIAFDEEFGIICLPATPVFTNIYGEPQTWRLFNFGYDGSSGGSQTYCKTFDASEVAIISDNPNYTAPIKMIQRYCQRTSDMNRTEEVYAKGTKSPNLVFINSEDKNTAAVLNEQIEQNKAVIVLDKDVGQQGLTPMSLQTGKTAGELITLMKATNYKLSQLYARLGICADEAIKGAQLTEDEVYQNGELSRRIFASAKQSREFGCLDVRNKFGIDISFHELFIANQAVIDEQSPQPQQEQTQ